MSIPKCQSSNSKHMISSLEIQIPNFKTGIPNIGFQISSCAFKCSNLKFKISYLKTQMQNPKCKIKNLTPKFKIPHPNCQISTSADLRLLFLRFCRRDKQIILIYFGSRTASQNYYSWEIRRPTDGWSILQLRKCNYSSFLSIFQN